MLAKRLAALGALAGVGAAVGRASSSRSAVSGSARSRTIVSSVTGMPPGPFPVGVTTIQFDDHSRTDPSSGGPRRLQTEIWYPAAAEAANLQPGRYSEYLGRGAIPGSIKAAEESDAIGGYRDGLTIEQLDAEWPGAAVRDARPHTPEQWAPGTLPGAKWPLVLFSHGSGAFRASYIYFTEFLASQGFCVVACDHAGSARYTQVDGEVVKPGGARSTRKQMETDRPADLLFLLDRMGTLAAGGDSRFAGRLDTSRCALTGMSFGGWASAQALEARDPRVKAAILQCPSLAMSGAAAGHPPLASAARADRATPTLVMLGTEDTVIGEEGNAAGRAYYETHTGPRQLLEIKRGGHVSFTSCELYNPEYGNGIGESKSLSRPGETYTPLPIAQQHEVINAYALAFLNAHLRPDVDGSELGGFGAAFLEQNHFDAEEVIWK
eukprot:Transcript_25652.p1 GENE.Transcript_25652~~Transcript_25652.p1  ORF type:complete len:437 (-),score=129.94 Transcript_25652:54-1364(-)